MKTFAFNPLAKALLVTTTLMATQLVSASVVGGHLRSQVLGIYLHDRPPAKLPNPLCFQGFWRRNPLGTR
jgi:hypothetical protein